MVGSLTSSPPASYPGQISRVGAGKKSGSIWKKTTPSAKDGDESPQEGVAPKAALTSRTANSRRRLGLLFYDFPTWLAKVDKGPPKCLAKILPIPVNA